MPNMEDFGILLPPPVPPHPVALTPSSSVASCEATVAAHESAPELGRTNRFIAYSTRFRNVYRVLNAADKENIKEDWMVFVRGLDMGSIHMKLHYDDEEEAGRAADKAWRKFARHSGLTPEALTAGLNFPGATASGARLAPLIGQGNTASLAIMLAAGGMAPGLGLAVNAPRPVAGILPPGASAGSRSAAPAAGGLSALLAGAGTGAVGAFAFPGLLNANGKRTSPLPLTTSSVPAAPASASFSAQRAPGSIGGSVNSSAHASPRNAGPAGFQPAVAIGAPRPRMGLQRAAAQQRPTAAAIAAVGGSMPHGPAAKRSRLGQPPALESSIGRATSGPSASSASALPATTASLGYDSGSDGSIPGLDDCYGDYEDDGYDLEHDIHTGDACAAAAGAGKAHGQRSSSNAAAAVAAANAAALLFPAGPGPSVPPMQAMPRPLGPAASSSSTAAATAASGIFPAALPLGASATLPASAPRTSAVSSFGMSMNGLSMGGMSGMGLTAFGMGMPASPLWGASANVSVSNAGAASAGLPSGPGAGGFGSCDGSLFAPLSTLTPLLLGLAPALSNSSSAVLAAPASKTASSSSSSSSSVSTATMATAVSSSSSGDAIMRSVSACSPLTSSALSSSAGSTVSLCSAESTPAPSAAPVRPAASTAPASSSAFAPASLRLAPVSAAAAVPEQLSFGFGQRALSSAGAASVAVSSSSASGADGSSSGSSGFGSLAVSSAAAGAGMGAGAGAGMALPLPMPTGATLPSGQDAATSACLAWTSADALVQSGQAAMAALAVDRSGAAGLATLPARQAGAALLALAQETLAVASAALDHMQDDASQAVASAQHSLTSSSSASSSSSAASNCGASVGGGSVFASASRAGSPAAFSLAGSVAHSPHSSGSVSAPSNSPAAAPGDVLSMMRAAGEPAPLELPASAASVSASASGSGSNGTGRTVSLSQALLPLVRQLASLRARTARAASTSSAALAAVPLASMGPGPAALGAWMAAAPAELHAVLSQLSAALQARLRAGSPVMGAANVAAAAAAAAGSASPSALLARP